MAKVHRTVCDAPWQRKWLFIYKIVLGADEAGLNCCGVFDGCGMRDRQRLNVWQTKT